MNSMTSMSAMSAFDTAVPKSSQADAKQDSKQEKFTPPRFEVDDPAAYTYLEDNGFVVIKSVADDDQLKEARSLLWSYICSVRPAVKRKDPETWATSNWLGFPNTGVIFGDGIGQSPFLWYVRSLRKVKQAFARVWNDDRLLVSFDGCGVFRPWQYREEWRTKGSWFHVDQSPVNKPGLQCVQGLVSLYDQNESTGGLSVLQYSPHAFDGLKDVCGLRSTFQDFVPIPADKLEELEKHNPRRLVSCKAGDLILWDSRTIHCNVHASVKPSLPAKGQPLELLRAVAYVCMTPASRAKDLAELRELRKGALETRSTTNHWPHEFSETSQFKQHAGRRNSAMNLDEYQMDLVLGTTTAEASRVDFGASNNSDNNSNQRSSNSSSAA